MNQRDIVLLVVGFFAVIAIGSWIRIRKEKIPRPDDVTFPAVEYWENDPNGIRTTSVRVKGKLYRPLFRQASFRGEIVIDKYDVTRTTRLEDVPLLDNKGALIYAKTENGIYNQLGFG